MLPVVDGSIDGDPVLVASTRVYPFALVAIVFATVTPLAIGQTGARQTAALTFDERKPAQTSGVRLAVDYVNPSDPAAKPFAVQKVVIALAPGTTIDTSVPALCTAANAELTANGPGACPAASKVGGGEIDLDSGAPGPARILPFDVSLLNNKGELILLLESKSEPRTRVVTRAPIEGSTLTSEPSPVPGGPPDGFTAIKRVRLGLEPISAGGRSYVTTPDSCPPEGAWTNKVTFTYRADGESQTVSTSSPCVGGAGPKPGGPDCVRRPSMSFNLHRRDGTRIVRVAAYVNGKPALSESGEDVRRVTLTGLPRTGRLGVRIVATHSTGSKVVSSRSWNGCNKTKPRVRVVRPR